DPQVLSAFLPAPIRPKVVRGVGLAGICLIRLRKIRPAFLPGRMGISSENAAHRIAVEWDEDGKTREGVYIPRRDTSSRLNAWAGGWLFPGIHHHARFTVLETSEQLRVAFASDDGSASLEFDGARINAWPENSVFDSLEEASAFFAA